MRGEYNIKTYENLTAARISLYSGKRDMEEESKEPLKRVEG